MTILILIQNLCLLTPTSGDTQIVSVDCIFSQYGSEFPFFVCLIMFLLKGRYLDNNVATLDSDFPQIVIVIAGFLVCFFVYKLACAKAVTSVPLW